MSLWTPDGERPVSREPAPSASTGGQSAPVELTPEIREALAAAGVDVDSLTPEQQAEAIQMMAEMTRVREQLLQTPAADVVANHLMGMYELAAIHMAQNPPNLAEATLGIEALAGVLDRLSGKFGENEPVLRQALTQLQQAFVELSNQVGETSTGDESE